MVDDERQFPKRCDRRIYRVHMAAAQAARQPLRRRRRWLAVKPWGITHVPRVDFTVTILAVAWLETFW